MAEINEKHINERVSLSWAGDDCYKILRFEFCVDEQGDQENKIGEAEVYILDSQFDLYKDLMTLADGVSGDCADSVAALTNVSDVLDAESPDYGSVAYIQDINILPGLEKRALQIMDKWLFLEKVDISLFTACPMHNSNADDMCQKRLLDASIANKYEVIMPMANGSIVMKYINELNVDLAS